MTPTNFRESMRRTAEDACSGQSIHAYLSEPSCGFEVDAILASPQMEAIRMALLTLSSAKQGPPPIQELRRVGLDLDVIAWVLDVAR